MIKFAYISLSLLQLFDWDNISDGYSTKVLQGGMLLPVFTTRATWLVMFAQGNGRFEMVGSQIQERQGHNNQKAVQGCLSVGDFFVIPAGHPTTVVANGESNLSMVGFGINGNNSRLNFLAGIV